MLLLLPSPHQVSGCQSREHQEGNGGPERNRAAAEEERGQVVQTTQGLLFPENRRVLQTNQCREGGKRKGSWDAETLDFEGPSEAVQCWRLKVYHPGGGARTDPFPSEAASKDTAWRQTSAHCVRCDRAVHNCQR